MRTGPSGLRPLRRFGTNATSIDNSLDAVGSEAKDVLEKARRPDGARKRENALKMKKAIEEGWTSGGSCSEDLARLTAALAKTVQ